MDSLEGGKRYSRMRDWALDQPRLRADERSSRGAATKDPIEIGAKNSLLNNQNPFLQAESDRPGEGADRVNFFLVGPEERTVHQRLGLPPVNLNFQGAEGKGMRKGIQTIV